MDYVDDFHANFVELESLTLGHDDKVLLQEVCQPYKANRVRYLAIERGLSGAIKLVAKPECLFPLFIKLDNAEAIKQEATGDRIIRNRVPPLSIPPLEAVVLHEKRGAIAYRYVTGGRVRHLIRRFDTALSELSTYSALAIIDDIFDVILKKCHWLDDQYKMRSIKLPEMPTNPDLDLDSGWKEIIHCYEKVREACSQVDAPHAVVHGDLHAKNVLITRDEAPVLIDFSMTKTDTCQYLDFAKFETFLQFQVDRKLSEEMWRIEGLLYGETPLVIPHSNSKLAACVHRIRSNLWQGCTRLSVQMDPNAIDLGYRGYLIYCLTRFYSRTTNSTDSRNRAHRQINALCAAIL